MKNWKLTVYEALTERLISLAAWESSSLLLDIYLDALTEVAAKRNQLCRAGRTRNLPRAVIGPAPDSCTRSA